MTPEVPSIVGVGIVLAGITLNGQRNARADYRALRSDIERRFERVQEHISALEQRIAVLDRGQAKLEGLLEGLREAVSGRCAAAGDD